jgi:hypothetical protein
MVVFKRHFSNKNKRLRQLTTVLVALAVAGVGTYLLVSSHAASPYVSITANTGIVSSPAAKQSCSGASNNGNCVVFGSSNGGGSVTGNNMMVGLDAGGWNTGNPGDDDVATAVKMVRLDYANCTTPIPITYPVSGSQYTECPSGGDIVQLQHDGVKMDIDFSGPYNTGGVRALVGSDPSDSGAIAWAANAISWYKTYCGDTNTECPIIEVLNEPDGWWFWGTDSSDTATADQDNANAYAELVSITYKAFHNPTTGLGANAPRILASADGSWGQEWWNADSSTLGQSTNYVDGVVSHPYGGDDGANAAEIGSSGAGDRAQVTAEHTLTNKPVYVTEVGWPTDDAGASPTEVNATGDSIQWPVADSAANAYHDLDQCDNVYNFVNWARNTNYVGSVSIYGYINTTANNAQYGLELYNTSNGDTSKKPAWYALKAAALQQPNLCPSASNNYAQPGQTDGFSTE